MEIYVLDRNFNSVYIIDEYESLIWTDRYCGYGDVEIYAGVTADLLLYAQADYYLWSNESEHMMIIEETSITTDTETGYHLKIVGRSLESILDRRIIWSETTIRGDLQNGIKKLLNDNAINPTDSNRKIPNLIFKDSTDPKVTSNAIEMQTTGDNLYDVIREICETCNLGFKITPNDNNQFIFELYAGVDRSYNQTVNPFVVFSPSFENILNSNYFENKSLLKNVALVAGEDRSQNRKTVTLEGQITGLDRRELYVDARDIQSKEDGKPLTETEYVNLLKDRGYSKLAENYYIRTFEGEVDTQQTYVYGVDFLMGDVVNLVNEYGIEGMSRITEIVFSQDTSYGNKVVPTFVMIDEDE